MTAGDTPLFHLRRADLAIRNDDVWQLQTDVQVLSELMHALSTDDPRRHEILRTLERALDCLDTNDIAATAGAARAVVAVALERPANASAHVVNAIGHAHIDTAWLWPQRETKRKAARTFANVTALAEEYPELIFACSQAQQYAWIKEEYPELYQRIQRAVAKRQWIPAGGMWVEADGNLPGGESLVRQLVAGKRFFLDEFGYDCPGVWLPDSFGYTAAFPQLARLAGMRWFLTQKISWNQTNRFPHHTFWWEGLDGTRIFTHFPPADTYNGTLTGRSWRTLFETSPTRVAEPDPCCPSDTATAAVARPARCWNGPGGCGTSKDLPASSSKIPTRSFGPRRRSTRTLRCGRASSI